MKKTKLRVEKGLARYSVSRDMIVVRIAGPAEMSEAVEILSRLNKTLDGLVAEREKVTKPLNEALRAERLRFKPYESKLEEAIAIVRAEMSRYQGEVVREAKRVEEEAARRLLAGKVSLEEAVSVAGGVMDKVETSSGSVKFRVDKVVRVVDVDAVPREYLIVDEKKVRADLLSGKEVSGCVLEEVQTVINRRI